MRLLGADWSYATPEPAALVRAGVGVAIRYVGPDAWGKTLRQGEYEALTRAGIKVFLVFEETATDGDGGYVAGQANARLALAHAPAGYTGQIFMACDTELTGAALARATKYVQGASSVLGASRTGVYGEGALLQLCRATGAASAFWLSGSTSFPGWQQVATSNWVHLIQRVGEVPGVPGTDLNTVVRLPGAVAPPPKPKGIPPGEIPTLHYGDTQPRSWIVYARYKLGMHLPNLGSGFGRFAVARVREVQKANGQPVTGVLDMYTWAILEVVA